VTTSSGVTVAAAAGTAVSTVVGTGVGGSVGGEEVTGTAVVTGLVAADWVQPAINMHAMITIKGRIPYHLINNFFFGNGIMLLPAGKIRVQGCTAGWNLC
jgi:hypothetical protein